VAVLAKEDYYSFSHVKAVQIYFGGIIPSVTYNFKF
jgi:hypothetical protein